MVWKRCRRWADFTPAYDCPSAHRTSNTVDRLLTSQDRLLYAMRYCHATTASARLAVRAMALQGNFHPYGARLRRDQPSRVSPFDDLNGFQSHPNWLHTLLIASSMGGLRYLPQIPLAPGYFKGYEGSIGHTKPLFMPPSRRHAATLRGLDRPRRRK